MCRIDVGGPSDHAVPNPVMTKAIGTLISITSFGVRLYRQVRFRILGDRQAPSQPDVFRTGHFDSLAHSYINNVTSCSKKRDIRNCIIACTWLNSSVRLACSSFEGVRFFDYFARLDRNGEE